MAPPKVALLSTRVASVAEPRMTALLPASAPMLWLKLLRSIVPPMTEKSLLALKTLAAPALNVPPPTMVGPE